MGNPPKFGSSHVENKSKILVAKTRICCSMSCCKDRVGTCYMHTGWWCNNHLEKYEFVNGLGIIPLTLWKIKTSFETANQHTLADITALDVLISASKVQFLWPSTMMPGPHDFFEFHFIKFPIGLREHLQDCAMVFYYQIWGYPVNFPYEIPVHWAKGI